MGLLKEGRFLAPRINPTVYLFDFDYFLCKNVFCEICKIVYWQIDLGLLQEGRFLVISIFAALGLSEKRIYFEKHMFCEIWKIVYCTVDFGLLQEGRLLGSSICMSLGYSEKHNFVLKTFTRKRFGNHERHEVLLKHMYFCRCTRFTHYMC